jgi:hypothetical protein
VNVCAEALARPMKKKNKTQTLCNLRIPADLAVSGVDDRKDDARVGSFVIAVLRIPGV